MNDYIQMLKQNARGDKVIFSDLKQQYNLDDIFHRSQTLLKLLQAQEVKSLGLYADNCIDWVVADLACQKAGIILLPLPTFFSASQLKHALLSCGVNLVLTDFSTGLEALLGQQCQAQFEVENSCLSLLVFESSKGEGLLPSGTGKITFTSGSTGQPKGVCLSNERLLQQAQALVQAVDMESPRHLCILPLSTLLENVAGIYAPLLAGGEIVIPRLEEMGFKGSALEDQAKFLSMISAIAPNSIILIPQLLLLLVHAVKSGWQPPATLKFIAVGGSKVSCDLLLEAQSLGLPVYEGYGLSECASVVSLNTVANNKPGSCGKPLPLLNIEIVEGEVQVMANTMLGYVNEPESWYPTIVKTGDLGSIDDEGYLQINGRKKNVLISSYGRNISPEWIESELMAIPLIAEALVQGDALPFCTALISPRFKETSNADIQIMLDSVNMSLPDYARIKYWHRLELPLSSQKNLVTENGRPRRLAIAACYKKEIENLYSRDYTPVKKQSIENSLER